MRTDTISFIDGQQRGIVAPLPIVQEKEIHNHSKAGKYFRYCENEFIFFPHDHYHTLLFHQLGYSFPSPASYGPFGGKEHNIEPLPLQVRTVDFMVKNPICFNLNEIGTGKTFTVLWALDYLKRHRFIRKTLVIAPLSTVDDVWKRSSDLIIPHLKSKVIHNPNKGNRIGLLMDPHMDVLICNHEGFQIIKEFLPIDIDLVVMDESQTYRNRTKTLYVPLHRWLEERKIPWRWQLSGTPIPQSSTDSWAQAKLAGKNLVSFTEFQSRLKFKMGMRWIERADSVDQAYAILQPAIRERRKDLGIQEPQLTTRTVPLTTEQKDAYEKLKRDAEIQFGSGAIVTAAHEADVINKLLQVTCGILYYKTEDEQPASLTLPAKKLKECKELIGQCEDKVIIFFPFKETINQAVRYFSEKKIGAVRVDGDVVKAKRDRIFDRFRTDPSIKVLLAHPRCMAHGLTLNEATMIIWFCPIYSNDIHQQANGRNSRIGQDKSTLIVHLKSTSLESEIYNRLASKKKLQGTLLEMYK